jgi:hypothetical protein
MGLDGDFFASGSSAPASCVHTLESIYSIRSGESNLIQHRIVFGSLKPFPYFTTASAQAQMWEKPQTATKDQCILD